MGGHIMKIAFGGTVLAGLLVAFGLSAAPARAQNFTKPVRIIVPFAPGGNSDILARIIQPKLQEIVGQPVVVENKPGGGAHIGSELVAKADKDGHTLLLSDLSHLAIAPALMPNLTYDTTKDLAPVGIIAFAPYVVSVHPDFPAKSIAELVAYGKANPGKMLFANPSIGASNHLTFMHMAKTWGIDVKAVPYKGGGDAMKAVVSGESHVTLNGATTSAAFMASNQVRALAVSGDEKLAGYNDLPTFKALGITPVDAGTFQGMMTTGGTPAAMVTRLNAELNKILAMPDIVKRINDLGGTIKAGPASETAAWIERNKVSFGQIVKDTGIKLQQ
jgi:tripartite-type tricarboxylate transporter receptor subunit TctC